MTAGAGRPGEGLPARVGLCAACRHVRRVPTDKGELFLRCALSTHDPAYARYPRLPVVSCLGYSVADDADAERAGTQAG